MKRNFLQKILFHRLIIIGRIMSRHGFFFLFFNACRASGWVVWLAGGTVSFFGGKKIGRDVNGGCWWSEVGWLVKWGNSREVVRFSDGDWLVRDREGPNFSRGEQGSKGRWMVGLEVNVGIMSMNMSMSINISIDISISISMITCLYYILVPIALCVRDPISTI